MRVSILRALVATGLSALVAIDCATSPQAEVPAPVPGQTVQTWIRELRGELGKALYMRNDGLHPIVITTVTLTNCENIRQVCGTELVNAGIAPGRTVIVFKVQPLNESRDYSFEYEYRWQGTR